MNTTKLKALQDIIDNHSNINTIHKLLQVLQINKRDVLKLEKEDKALYDLLKQHCELLVANLYELIIDRPRQAAQFLQLAKEQENYYNTIFGENMESAIVPEIIIKREKSITNIKLEDN